MVKHLVVCAAQARLRLEFLIRYHGHVGGLGSFWTWVACRHDPDGTLHRRMWPELIRVILGQAAVPRGTAVANSAAAAAALAAAAGLEAHLIGRLIQASCQCCKHRTDRQRCRPVCVEAPVRFSLAAQPSTLTSTRLHYTPPITLLKQGMHSDHCQRQPVDAKSRPMHGGGALSSKHVCMQPRPPAWAPLRQPTPQPAPLCQSWPLLPRPWARPWAKLPPGLVRWGPRSCSRAQAMQRGRYATCAGCPSSWPCLETIRP